MASQSILMLHNVAKKKNFGELIRTAAAMGVSEIVVVGAQKLMTQGCHGTAGYVKFSHFDKFNDAVSYLKNVRGASLCGVEICEAAKPVQRHPFAGACTAFLMGNEGAGLTPNQIAACDQFVYIPQHSDATASLNVNAACAVVLHHFAIWAALPEAPREGYKYVQGVPGQTQPDSEVGLKKMRTLNADGSIVQHRMKRHNAGDAGGEEEGGGGGDVDGKGDDDAGAAAAAALEAYDVLGQRSGGAESGAGVDGAAGAAAADEGVPSSS